MSHSFSDPAAKKLKSLTVNQLMENLWRHLQEPEDQNIRITDTFKKDRNYVSRFTRKFFNNQTNVQHYTFELAKLFHAYFAIPQDDFDDIKANAENEITKYIQRRGTSGFGDNHNPHQIVKDEWGFKEYMNFFKDLYIEPAIKPVVLPQRPIYFDDLNENDEFVVSYYYLQDGMLKNQIFMGNFINVVDESIKPEFCLTFRSEQLGLWFWLKGIKKDIANREIGKITMINDNPLNQEKGEKIEIFKLSDVVDTLRDKKKTNAPPDDIIRQIIETTYGGGRRKKRTISTRSKRKRHQRRRMSRRK